MDTVTPIRGVCLNCFTDFGEDRNFLGVLGRPEILVCPSGLSFSHETVTLGQPLGEVILAIQPISTAPTPVCITLTERGELYPFLSPLPIQIYSHRFQIRIMII